MEQIINQYHLTQIKDRKVSYRKIGNGSRKILFFHGFPGSSIQIELFSPLIHVLDLEVLCFDRPGYNETEISESESQYTQVSFIARALLHSFGWTKCEVVSVSGGTPFLFSFLKTSAELVSKVTVMSGLGPLAQKEFMDMMSLKTKIGLKVILAIPGTILKRTILFGLKNRNSNKFNLVRFFMPVANADLKVLQQKKVQLTFSQALQEAFLQNGAGPKRDAKSFMENWPLVQENIKCAVSFWHGDSDQIVPYEMAQLMSQMVSGSSLHIISNEGHYSLSIGKISEILSFK